MSAVGEITITNAFTSHVIVMGGYSLTPEQHEKLQALRELTRELDVPFDHDTVCRNLMTPEQLADHAWMLRARKLEPALIKAGVPKTKIRAVLAVVRAELA